jgi:hypothetical protein
MFRPRPIVLAVLCLLITLPALAAAKSGRLDLDVDPAQVRAWDAHPPPHDLVIAPSAPKSPYEPEANALGWSLRPTVDLNVGQADAERIPSGGDEHDLDLGDLTVDLESVGVRLRETW